MKRKTIKVHPKEIKKSAARHGEEEWLRTFQIMDYNEDNYVDLIEFESAIRNGADRWRVSVEVAKKLFQHVDRNNDQRVDLNEFCLMARSDHFRFWHRFLRPLLQRSRQDFSHCAHRWLRCRTASWDRAASQSSTQKMGTSRLSTS
ncbi:hypothetical protein M3Y98_00712800 [Aphelenchoides besseyi]|nr:hypothetical protein M3Y98_00712800 [Aphelenchoides besseyi]